MLKQAGEISGGANKNIASAGVSVAGGATGGGSAAAGAGASGGENTFLQAVLKLKNGPKMGATGSSTLAGAVTAAMAQQSQQPSLPDINVINVPEYPERISRRGGGAGGGATMGSMKASGGGGGGGLQQPQQNKGLSAPLADISSSGPNQMKKSTLIFKSRVSIYFLFYFSIQSTVCEFLCMEAFFCIFHPEIFNYYTL